jgi:hypothetical protein
MGESESGSEESHELENLERADGTDEPFFDCGRGSARNHRMSRLSGDRNSCDAVDGDSKAEPTTEQGTA